MAKHKGDEPDDEDDFFRQSDPSSEDERPQRKKLKMRSSDAKKRAIVSAFLDTEAQVCSTLMVITSRAILGFKL